MGRILLIAVMFLSLFLYSCAFDNSEIVKKVNFLEEKINFDSERISENSKRLDSIESQIAKIKERLAEERKRDNFLSEIPPAKVIDNLTEESDKISSNQREKKYNNSSGSIGVSLMTTTEGVTNTSKGNTIKSKKSLNFRQANTGELKEKGVNYNNTELSPNRLYRKALNKYFNGNYEGAKKLFKEFLARFSVKNPLYDNSMFWLAYCYIHEGDTKQAITILKSLINKFPYASLEEGGKTDAAIYTLIKIYKKEGNKGKIQLYKKLLLKRFPASKYTGYLKRRFKG